MDRRIYGLETEYGVACTSGGTRRLTPDEVWDVDWLDQDVAAVVHVARGAWGRGAPAG